MDLCTVASFNFLGHGDAVLSMDPFGIPEPYVSPASDVDTCSESDSSDMDISESDSQKPPSCPPSVPPSSSPQKKPRQRKGKGVRHRERVLQNAHREAERDVYGREHSLTERRNYAKNSRGLKESTVFQSTSLGVTETVAQADFSRTGPGFTGLTASQRAKWDECLDADREKNKKAKGEASQSTTLPSKLHSSLYSKMVEDVPDDMGEQDMDISPVLSPIPDKSALPSISSLTESLPALSVEERLRNAIYSKAARAARPLELSELHADCDLEVRRKVAEEGYKYFARDKE